MASPADSFDRRNLLTYTSLLCGVGAVAAASAGLAGMAGLGIAVAVIADTFDGRVARRFGSDPRRCALGTELDSLADAIAFGVAPPLCSALFLNVTADVGGTPCGAPSSFTLPARSRGWRPSTWIKPTGAILSASRFRCQR